VACMLLKSIQSESTKDMRRRRVKNNLDQNMYVLRYAENVEDACV